MYRILTGLIFCVTLHSSQLWADVQVQGYLNQAAMENLAADPTCVPATTCPDGRIYWNTVANEPRIWDGAAWQEMLVGSSVVPDPLLLGDGTAGAPTYSFSSETSSGVLLEDPNVVGIAGHLDNSPGGAGIEIPSDIWVTEGAISDTYGLMYHSGSFNTAWNWNWYRSNGVNMFESFGINGSNDAYGIHLGPTNIAIYADATYAAGGSSPFQALQIAETFTQFNHRVDFAGDAVQIDADSGIVIDTSDVVDNVEIEFTGSEAANIYAINDPAQDMFLTASDLVYIRPGGNVATNETVFQANGQINATEGSAANPTYTFDGNNDGMYRRSTTSLGFSVEGTEQFIIGNTVIRAPNHSIEADDSGSSSPSFAFVGDSDSGLYGTNGGTIGLSSDGTTFVSWGGNTTLGTSVRVGSDTSPAVPCINLNSAGLRNFRACASSIRYKENVKEITDEVIDASMKIKAVSFDWKKNGVSDYGVIAEDVEKHVPEIVQYTPPDGGDENTPKDKWIVQSVNYRHFTALLLAQNQRQEKKINDLLKRIEALEAQ